jgi:hypothetical protein
MLTLSIVGCHRSRKHHSEWSLYDGDSAAVSVDNSSSAEGRKIQLTVNDAVVQVRNKLSSATRTCRRRNNPSTGEILHRRQFADDRVFLS